MGKSIVDFTKNQKKARGRRQTPRGRDLGTPVMVRLSADELARLDAWIAEQKEKLGVELSRPAAIRARLNTSESAPLAKPATKRGRTK
jgi:cytochrome c553